MPINKIVLVLPKDLIAMLFMQVLPTDLIELSFYFLVHYQNLQLPKMIIAFTRLLVFLTKGHCFILLNFAHFDPNFQVAFEICQMFFPVSDRISENVFFPLGGLLNHLVS